MGNMLDLNNFCIGFSLILAQSARHFYSIYRHQRVVQLTHTRIHTHTRSGQSHQIVHPLPQPTLPLVCTIIFLSEPSSSQSPCSPHSHFTPTELIRGGGYSCMPAEYTL